MESKEETSPHMKTKQEKLDHYAEREPREFKQYDGFYFEDKLGDDFTTPDADGDSITFQGTCELMTGPDGVRVLIPMGTEKKDAIRLLKKITKWIEGE